MTAISLTKIQLGTARQALVREVGPKQPQQEEFPKVADLLGQPAPQQPTEQSGQPMTTFNRKTRELDSRIAKVLSTATPVKLDEIDEDDLEIPVEEPANRNVPKLPELFLPTPETEPLSQLEQSVMHDLISNFAGRKTKSNLAAVTPNVPINPPLVPTANQRLEPDTLIAELPLVPSKPTRQSVVAPQAPAPLLVATPPRTARGTEPRAIVIPEKSEPIAVKQPLLALAPQPLPMTPLEQAVHDLIIEAKLDDNDEHRDEHPLTSPSMPSISIADVVDTHRAVEAKPEVAGPREIPPQPVENQNHVHLVIDDGGERVVVTVAVRGDNVNVNMRSSDEGTAAALARNAGSLDHAMRGRGLNLAQLDSGHQHESQRQQREREQQQRDRRAIEEFTLDLEVA